MKKIGTFITIFSICFSVNSYSQKSSENIELLSGNLKLDSEILLENYQYKELPSILPQTNTKKSPFLAGLFSFILPGAGEIYTENYLKGAIFLVVEAAAITTAIIYDKKGDDKTNEFEKYADENWSVVKYAEWLNLHVIMDEDQKIPINPDESLPPWERVNFSVINQRETGSHKLPPHGDQQYYELIGKYPQYSPGWDEFTISEPDYHILPPQFTFYSGMRGDANDLYNVASTAVIFIYINHFLSVVDAVWSAAQYNKNIALNVRMEQINLANQIEWIPTLKFSYNF